MCTEVFSILVTLTIACVLLPLGVSSWADDERKVAVETLVTGWDIEYGFNVLIGYLSYRVMPIDVTVQLKRVIVPTRYGYERLQTELKAKIGERASAWWYPRYGLSFVKLTDGHGATIVGAVSLLICITFITVLAVRRRRAFPADTQ